ncbi:Myc-associated zinc finger protein [Liparis tanakae]|uniref:Myc-associated zinc finger protein n=1 Tax=Liparis tanakae TaxID=230148 RepID=A0A4Z2HEJ4_9TELE|nr:Myc-associated zinc finger protein [Liparis tanakae]
MAFCLLLQNTPTQNQVDGSLQSELMPVHTSSPQTPPTEHTAQPPSTVDTAALSEEPLPVKPVSRPARMPHICAICNKQFKNNYNLRRHQSVHTGVRMKDRAREQAEGAQEGAAGQAAAAAAPSAMAVGAGGRVQRTTVPLSLLHLSAPPLLAPPVVLAGGQQPPLGSQDGGGVSMANVMASVNPHAPPPAAVVMATGATVQVGFTTLTYLRVHAQKHHGQEWKDSPGGFGTTSGGILVCHLCGIHCKTPTQLQGHMGTHGNNQGAPSPAGSNAAAGSSVNHGNMGAAPTVYVTGNTVVDLLVTDCSSIAAPQSHS